MAKPVASQPLSLWRSVFTLVRLPNLLIMMLSQALVHVCLLEQPLHLNLLLIALSTALIGAAGYIINDYYDVKIDAINKPQRLVVGRSITRRKSMLAHLVLSGAGVLLGLVVNWKVAVANLVAVLLLWGYSDLLKRRLLIGNLVIAVLAAIMLLVVALPYQEVPRALWAYAVFSFLITLVREIVKDVEDMKGDASFDCRTLPIVAGLQKTRWVLYAVLVLFVAFLLLVVAVSTTSLIFDIYMIVLVLLPTLVLAWKLRLADRRRDFSQLSMLNKLIMLTGILSMLLLL